MVYRSGHGHYLPRRRPRNRHLPPQPHVLHPSVESHERAHLQFRDYSTPEFNGLFYYYNRPGAMGKLQSIRI